MKIAIIIGVSDYANAPSLPACKNDAQIINDIILQSEKYQSVLYIDKETNSSSVKSSVAKFISENAENDIDELFFYFSGHGVFTGTDFHYALSDVHIERLKQTSYENSELDQQIRSLSPKLTVKIVDACQSGVAYLKNTDADLEKVIRQKSKEFEKCYFMLSSNSDQSSYASSTLSNFTGKFIEAIALCPSEDVRYKDIIDYISDSFSNNSLQTPYFISQANFTEIFIPLSSSLRKRIATDMTGLFPSPVTKTSKSSLLEKIREDAKRYFSKDQALSLYEKIGSNIDQKKSFSDPETKELFDLDHNFNPSNKIMPKKTQVAEWLDKSSDSFFVRVHWAISKVKRRIPKNALGIIPLSSFGAEPEYEIKDFDEKYCDEIYNTTDLPYSSIVTKANRKYPNINSSECHWVFFISETKLAILKCFVPFKTSDWDNEVQQQQEANWTAQTFNLTDENRILEFIDESFNLFSEYSIKPIKEKLISKPSVNQEILTLNKKDEKRGVGQKDK